MWKVFSVLCVSLLAWPAQAKDLRLGGSGVGLELTRILAEQFAKDRAGVTVSVAESLGTGGGIRALAAGKLDVAVIMRPLKTDEVAGGETLPLCRTPWTFYVNATRADVALTGADLPALFLSALPPFARGEVRPLLRPANETGFQYLEKAFPGLSAAVAAARENRAAVTEVTDQDAMSAVENGPALVGFGALAPMVAERRALRAVPLDGIDAATMSPAYPHWAEVYLALGAASSASSRAFAAFVASPAAQASLRANGCLPVTGRVP